MSVNNINLFVYTKEETINGVKSKTEIFPKMISEQPSQSEISLELCFCPCHKKKKKKVTKRFSVTECWEEGNGNKIAVTRVLYDHTVWYNIKGVQKGKCHYGQGNDYKNSNNWIQH